MEMRGQMPWRFDKEMRECVVDLSRLDTRQAEADFGNGVDERLQQPAQSVVLPWVNPGLPPRVGKPVLSIRPDMHARQHDLRVIRREHPCFFNQLRNRPRPVVAASDSGRAKGAMLIAAVLDFQERPGPHPLTPSPLRGEGQRDPGRGQHSLRIRIRDHRAPRRQRRDRAVVQRRGASHHDRLGRAALRHMAHETPQLDFAFVSDRAGVDDGEIGDGGIIDHNGALVAEPLANHIGVVLIRPAAKGMEVDPHGRTVSPRRNVKMCSFNPVPLRSRCSTPKSIRPRPAENCFPRPAERPTSVGGWAPAPNGIWPPRAPNRNPEPSCPISAPNEQLNVLCPLAALVLQSRQAAVPATVSWLPRRHCAPAPYEFGRSLLATGFPRMSASSLESARNHPERRSADVRSMSALTETAFPPYATWARAVVLRKAVSPNVRVATTRVEPVSTWNPPPSVIQRFTRPAMESRRSVTAPPLVT